MPWLAIQACRKVSDKASFFEEDHMAETDMTTHEEAKELETARQTFEGRIEMFRSVMTAGQNAVKSAFLINGVAAVAVLAFIAQKGALHGVVDALLPFSWGVFLAAATSGMTYLSQWLYAKPEMAIAVKAGWVLNIGCMALGASSYVAFMLGVYAVHGALGG